MQTVDFFVSSETICNAYLVHMYPWWSTQTQFGWCLVSW